MATRWAVATGNWSNTATWNGGTLPTTGDDVFANGFTVTIDQNITVTKISTAINPSTSIAGGGFVFASAANRTLTCNIEAGTTLCLLINDGGGRPTIIGNVTGGTATGASGITLNPTTGGTLSGQPIIYGNITGGTANNATGLNSRTDRSYSPTVYGNITSGTIAPGMSLGTTQPNVITVYGNVTANGSVGINSGGSLFLFGIATASNTTYGANIFSIAYVSGAVINSAGYWGIYVPRLYVSTSNTLQFTLNEQTTNNNITLYSANSFVGIPAASNVRNGIVYGVSGSLTGTLVVPPASAVTDGVIFDNGTIGTAQNTAASFLAELAVSTDPLAERLRNVSTVQTTGAQIAAYNV